MSFLNEIAADIHTKAVEKGFWEDGMNFPVKIALMHSELSEALEEHRSGRDLVWFEDGKPEGVAVELVDCLIRILDTLAAMGVDIDTVVEVKRAYNTRRPRLHGKNY